MKDYHHCRGLDEQFLTCTVTIAPVALRQKVRFTGQRIEDHEVSLYWDWSRSAAIVRIEGPPSWEQRPKRGLSKWLRTWWRALRRWRRPCWTEMVCVPGQVYVDADCAVEANDDGNGERWSLTLQLKHDESEAADEPEHLP